MSPKSFTFSAALCLALAIGPATVLSVPQLSAISNIAFQGGLPLLGGDKIQDVAPATGDSEHDAGAGFDVGIPDGPAVKFGAGTHSETHGPCGPGVSSEHDAGAGYDVGIPDGPAVKFGAGTHDAYQAHPCPEIVEVPTTTEVVMMPSTTEAMVEMPSTTEVMVEMPPTSTSTYIPVMIPPTYTTPIPMQTMAPVPLYTPPAPVPVHSTPFVQQPAPTAMPSPMPVFNAGSALTPGSSLMAIALPVILGFFYY
ncbi:hypothetical protein F1880_006904 [Penicillium rolfsii]|nr:hypothetical protein F1880_006904 [Penicillium rolfsii]